MKRRTFVVEISFCLGGVLSPTHIPDPRPSVFTPSDTHLPGPLDSGSITERTSCDVCMLNRMFERGGVVPDGRLCTNANVEWSVGLAQVDADRYGRSFSSVKMWCADHSR